MYDTIIIPAYVFTTINLLILVAVLMSCVRRNSANGILACFLFMHAAVFGLHLLIERGNLSISHYYFSSLPAALVGPFAYLYTSKVLSVKSFWTKDKALHFISPIVYTLLLAFSNSLPFPFFNNTTSVLYHTRESFPPFLLAIIYIQLPAYYFYSWWVYKKYSSSTNVSSVKVRHVKNCNLIISSLLVLFYIFDFSSSYFNSQEIGSVFIAPFILIVKFIFVLIISLQNNQVFSTKNEKLSVNPEKKEAPEPEQEMVPDLREKLFEVFERRKVYLDKDLNLKKLSGILEVKSRHISTYINSTYKKNLNDFINDYRVNEAKQMLLDQEYENFKLEVIGEKSGFNSWASFFYNFKKNTGLTPSSFKKMNKVLLEAQNV